MTQEDIAEGLGRSRATVAQIEAGSRSASSAELERFGYLYTTDIRGFLAPSFGVAAMVQSQGGVPNERARTAVLDSIALWHEFARLEEVLSLNRAVANDPGLPHWELLRRRLERAQAEEISMNERVKRLWLPGSVALLVSLLLLSLQRFVVPVSAGYWFPVPREKTLVLCLPWLVLLPAVGALAAFVCRRAGGGTHEQIVVSLFPALAYAGLFAAILPGALIVDHIYRNVGLAQMLTGFAASAVSWVIAPGIALFCGALPFLAKGPSNRSSAAIS